MIYFNILYYSYLWSIPFWSFLMLIPPYCSVILLIVLFYFHHAPIVLWLLDPPMLPIIYAPIVLCLLDPPMFHIFYAVLFCSFMWSWSMLIVLLLFATDVSFLLCCCITYVICTIWYCTATLTHSFSIKGALYIAI